MIGGLFSSDDTSTAQTERLRPRMPSEVISQQHLLKAGKPLAAR